MSVESRDDIYVEDPNADVDLAEEDVTKALAGSECVLGEAEVKAGGAEVRY